MESKTDVFTAPTRHWDLLAAVSWRASLILLVTLCLVQLLGYLHSALRPDLRQIPGPVAARFTQLWRVWRLWSGDALNEYPRIHKRYGKIVRTAPNVISVADIEMIPVIYGIGSKYQKSGFYDTMIPVIDGQISHSTFSVKDPLQHQLLKRPVSQKYSMTSIRSMEHLVEECIDIFIAAMADLAGTPVDLGEWLHWYAFDVIGAITFNRRFGFMEQRADYEQMIAGGRFSLWYAGIVGLIPGAHKWLLGQYWVRVLLGLFQPGGNDPILTIARVIDQSIADYDSREANSQKTRTDFLAYLRQTKDNGQFLSDHMVKNHLSNNLLAGSDTTAISLRAVLYYLLKTPSALKKLQAEIDQAERNSQLSQHVLYEECLQLPYLQACLKEAMRMHPGVGYPLERSIPPEGANISGFHLRGGTIVGIAPSSIHQLKSIYGEDAHQFRPERWIQSDAEQIKVMDRNLLTFGYGARTCLGKNISIMEMGKLVPQILRHFHLEWASPEPDWKVETWWMSRQTGLIVKFTVRDRS